MTPSLTPDQEKAINKKFELVKQKGMCQYKYIDNFGKIFEVVLLSRENFYSMLKNETTKESKYQHAKTVFKELECQNLGYYHYLCFLSADVLLLAHFFEIFRDRCQQIYKLNPARF